jgi:protein subunit release factor A
MNDDYKIEVIYEQTGTTERPGGQHAGSPACSVRVTHIPTGIMAQCGIFSSQFRNKKTAIEMIEWALTNE